MLESKNTGSGTLADHKKIGKKFVPPFIATLGPLLEVRWVNDLVPELIWIALLHEKHGLQAGADLARQLALAAVEAREKKPKKWFAAASAFADLKAAERGAILGTLHASNALSAIRDALRPLAALYNDCPLRFLFEGELPSDDAMLPPFKGGLESMVDLWDSPATFVQATAVYIAFSTDVLEVMKGLALANFPAIEEFPNTEESKRVAGAIRSTVSMFEGQFKDAASSAWISHFWSRGLELEPCTSQIAVVPLRVLHLLASTTVLMTPLGCVPALRSVRDGSQA
jgi:hypothetical protein